MAGAAAMLQFLQSALLTQSFGAYVAILSEQRGWSKTALSGAAAGELCGLDDWRQLMQDSEQRDTL